LHYIDVPHVEYEKLSDDRLGEPSAAIRARVEAARDALRAQRRRFAGTRLWSGYAEEELRRVRARASDVAFSPSNRVATSLGTMCIPTKTNTLAPKSTEIICKIRRARYLPMRILSKPFANGTLCQC
jgi:predicted ATPase with chaperone activity